MATLLKQAGAQWELTAQFGFDISTADAMVNSTVAFPQSGSPLTLFSAASGTTFDVIPLPLGMIVTGGDMVVNVVSNDTGTSTMSIGDSASATRYLAATNLKAAARTALTVTGYVGLGEQLRLTLANQNGNATTGKATVTVRFVLPGKVNEVLREIY